jgi:hypothetical protein
MRRLNNLFYREKKLCHGNVFKLGQSFNYTSENAFNYKIKRVCRYIGREYLLLKFTGTKRAFFIKGDFCGPIIY